MNGQARSGAVLSVDLDALAANYRTLSTMAGPGRCAAVVKADAYGLGAGPVSRRLTEEGCDTFFVATLGEGLALRAMLTDDVGIFVLNGIPPGAETEAVRADLVPVLSTMGAIERWRNEAHRQGAPLDAAIQVDSGMARLGLSREDVLTIAGNPDLLSGIRAVLFMSHLACADEPSSPANMAQLKAFRGLRSLFPQIPASLANSSGMFLGRKYGFDLARPGAALYGINPVPGSENPMRPVVSLMARVLQVREVNEGIAVGYGHRYWATRDRQLAVISIGYADGWMRHVDLGAMHRGKRLPLAGRVSMDSITVDASGIPPDRLREGGWVDLIDARQTVDEVAAAAGTIGYELLCGLGQRIAREYVHPHGN